MAVPQPSTEKTHWQNRLGIQERMWGLILLMLALVLIVWLLFYSNLSAFFQGTTQHQIETSAGHVMSELESELRDIELIAFKLTQHATVKEFLLESDSTRFHRKSSSVYQLLSDMLLDTQLVNNLILYNGDGVYYRFSGTLGNTSAKRLYYTINPERLPQNIAVQLEGHNYIGYASGVYDAQRVIGTVVILLEESHIRSLLASYDQSDVLQIALTSEGKTLVSTSDSFDAGLSEASYIQSKRIGITPFEVKIYAGDDYLSSTRRSFSIAVVVTTAAFATILLFFAQQLQKRFFSPIITIISGVEGLGAQEATGRLTYTGEEDAFTSLVYEINSMLDRLEENNRTMTLTRLHIHQMEIKQHKAVITSLKKQINAHFTINVLNSIKLLAGAQEHQKVNDMCDGLSLLLRYAHDADEFIALQEEFQTIESYAEIMNIRYSGRFDLLFDLHEALYDVVIPRMILQPIIENAMMHAFNAGQENCRIQVLAKPQGPCIGLSVADNGSGMSAESLDRVRAGIAAGQNGDPDSVRLDGVALTNIQTRLSTHYGAECKLNIESSPQHGTTVSILLPRTPG